MYIELKDKYDNYFAHTKKNKDSETLTEHLLLTQKYLNKIISDKDLNNTIDDLIKVIDYKYFDLIKRLFLNAIFLHDLGKINPSFQINKMNNKLFEETTKSSNHSLLGALEYIKIFKPEIETINSDEEYYKISYIFYNFAYQISKHHGKLTTLDNFLKDENDFIKNYNLDNYFEFYILNKLLFSLLISSDYYATTEYMADIKFNDFGILSESKKFKLKGDFERYIDSFGEPKGINILRDELSNEAKNNLLNNLDKNIFYLEAPTGSGKTLTSINLALNILETDAKINKLFYIFPFNTLVEQTKKVFDDIFKDELNIEVINSITPMSIDNEDAQESMETKYNKAYLSRLFFHKEAIITTHITLFNILFGTSKEDNFPLWQLANSIIILDEIQSYNNHLWWYMVEFFDKYAKYLNIKIIIMSATLPKLDYFLENKNNFIDLIAKDKRDYFFEHELFKNRVNIDYSLLKNKITLDELYLKLKDINPKYKKILFEFISKKTARDFFDLIEKKFDNVHELSGDDNKAYRQSIINKTKEDKNIIVVATQVIEAGVDIDMDLGFKDISTIDSEEQFMGRINRSCKKNSINPKVYFFDFDDVENIYKNDNRLGYDLTQTKYQKLLEDKDFSSYYTNVLEDIKKDKNRFRNGLMTDYNNFENDIKSLNYLNISKTMTLINSQTFTLYFPFMIDISNYVGVKEFENLDNIFLTNNLLDGQKVWDEFINLNDINNFIEKQITKSKLNSLMQFFTFSLFKYFEKQRPYIGDEIYGYYFVENYGEFITDNYKFNRDKYNDLKDELFL
ncbi:MAG: CRISPR-associated helicase Cas3' [Campylobacterota bacterium]|nr:CRISPR-associated helicase Cas3' [Campylobacterota bacterium]